MPSLIGMCPASPIWPGCSIIRIPSTKTCPIGMCPASPICRGCFMRQVHLNRRYAVPRGSTRRHRKIICSPVQLGPYQIQCAVRECFVHCISKYVFPFKLLLPPSRSILSSDNEENKLNITGLEENKKNLDSSLRIQKENYKILEDKFSRSLQEIQKLWFF